MLHVVAKGALIGGGVGAALAAVRTPAPGQADPDKLGRVVKSAAEGALAGAAVGFALDRSLRRKATAAFLAGAPVVMEAVADFAQRAEPVVERFAEVARDRAVDAYSTARPIVVDAYETARPRVEDAVDVVRSKAQELRSA